MPSPTATKKIPVLAIFGDQDRQMDPLQAAAAYRSALAQAGNPMSRVALFPKANHGMVVSESGCPEEDQQRDRAVCEEPGLRIGERSAGCAPEGSIQLRAVERLSLRARIPGYDGGMAEGIGAVGRATAKYPPVPSPTSPVGRCRWGVLLYCVSWTVREPSKVHRVDLSHRLLVPFRRIDRDSVSRCSRSLFAVAVIGVVAWLLR